MMLSSFSTPASSAATPAVDISRIPGYKPGSIRFRVSSAAISSSTRYVGLVSVKNRCNRSWILLARAGGGHGSDGENPNLNVETANLTRRGSKSVVIKRFSDESDGNDRDSSSRERIQLGSGGNFASFREDPIVDKLRTQLGVIHPLPSPPISQNVLGLFVFFFFVGVGFDKIWMKAKRAKSETRASTRALIPMNVSTLLEEDLQRKEFVEWMNMVLGKLWKVYRGGIENWLVGTLQPVIDDLNKPDYVKRVEVKQFSFGDEPLSVRSVEHQSLYK